MKIKEFDPQIYPRKLWVVIKPDKKKLESQFDDTDDIMADLDDDAWDASVFHVYNHKHNLGGMMIIFKDYRNITPSNVTHESIHVAMEILKYVDVKLDYDNQEPLAYLAGWVTECVYKVIS